MAARTHARPPIHKRVAVATHGTQDPKRIIIHCTESPNRPGVSDVLAIPNFWKRQGQGYGTHLVIDGEGNTCQCAIDTRICWGCGGSNTGSLQIEIIGYSASSAAEWAKQIKGLKQAAKWTAYWCEQHEIPIALSVNAGIATHAMHSRAFHKTDHTDPGKNFPLAQFMRNVRYYHAHGWFPAPNA